MKTNTRLILRLCAFVAVALLGVSCSDLLGDLESLKNKNASATWSYTVTFDSQSATVACDPTSKTVTSPATTVVTLPTAPTKTGFAFAGWYTAVDGGGTEFTVSTAVTADITVFAKWSANAVYTVTYNSDGGSVVGVQHVTLPATSVGTLPTGPTKTGYIFGGWWTEANGGGSEFTESTAVAAEITVFAKWTATVTLLVIPGVTAPVTGAIPVTTAINTAQYTGTISWVGSPTTFAATTSYTATIVLTAKTGWTMTGVAANSFTVEGAAGAAATNAVDSDSVTTVFPTTSAVLDYDSANIGVLKYVPAGSFQCDVTADNISTITTAYRMSRYEITRAQFSAIMGTDPSNTTYSSGTNDPVQKVNWYHAITFCNKLSIAEGLTLVYAVTGVDFATLTYAGIPTVSNTDWNATTATWTNNGYRLPTEMEWMWAAMGAIMDLSNGYTGSGTNTTGYTKGYAGSTEITGTQTNIGNYAWYSTNSSSKTHSVGSKTVNELGLYDMSGNVWEWNWDIYGTYPTGTQTDYRGAVSGAIRVFRGGDKSNNASSCTVAGRSGGYPYIQANNGGFRVVRP